MAYMDPQTTKGGAWLVIHDDSVLRYEVDKAGENIDLSIIGPIELELGLSMALVKRCRDLFDEALTEMIRAEKAAR